MASGKVHAQVSLATAGFFAVTGAATGDLTTLEQALGALIGTIVTPDLDVDRGFIGDVIIRNKVGKWAEHLWDMFWYFYRTSVKHGSPLSHFPIISTLGRLTYVALFLLIIPYLFLLIIFPDMDISGELAWWWDRIAQHRAIIQGLITTDTLHWFLDVVTTNNKVNLRVVMRRIFNSVREA